TNVIWSFSTHSLNLNGPVPTRLWAKSPLAFATPAGETGEQYDWLTASRNGAKALLNSALTVKSSMTVACENGPIWLNAVLVCVSGSTTRLHENVPASALSGVPSWNFTSLLSVTVNAVPYGATSLFSAKP